MLKNVMKTQVKTCYKNNTPKIIKIITKKLPKWWPKRALGRARRRREKCVNRPVPRQTVFLGLFGPKVTPGPLQSRLLVSLFGPKVASGPLQSRLLVDFWTIFVNFLVDFLVGFGSKSDVRNECKDRAKMH